MILPPRSHRETWMIAGLAAIGGIARAWPPGRLGLVHFDEGIYATAATWSLHPGGLAAIGPTLIPYAPPGFPILAGLAAAAFGSVDGAGLLVSIVAGSLTIGAIGQLGRAAFGTGAGFAAAALAAGSGLHIAFSRMALTDATFLLTWVLAIGAGVRFLDRPTFGRGLGMGLAVGMAQQVKYNGWVAGLIVLSAAVIGLARPEGRSAARLARVFGWGGVGIVAAGLVVLPWFLFVERHGGYAALLEHQRGYLVGTAGWASSLRAQLAQGVALSGSRMLVVAVWIVAAAGARWFRSSVDPDGSTRPDRWVELALVATAGVLLVMIPGATWWLALGISPWLLAGRSAAMRVVGAWWAITSILTPFYHPYARLWLPVEAANWLIVGGGLASGLESAAPYLRRIRGRSLTGDPRMSRFGLAWAWWVGVGVTCTTELERLDLAPRPLPGLLGPTDGLRLAVAEIAAKIPPGTRSVRYYGRPTIRFYLGGRLPVQSLDAPGAAFRPAGDDVLALIDFANLSPRVLPAGVDSWEQVGFAAAPLNGPTELDLDPDAAYGVHAFGRRAAAPLLLYRPIPGGTDR